MYLPQKLGAVPLDTRIQWIGRRDGGKDMLLAKGEELWHDILGNYDMESFDDSFGMAHNAVTLTIPH